jgi:hypothetical protein
MWPYYKLLPNLPRPPQKFFDESLLDYDQFPTETPLHEIRIRHSSRNGENFVASRSVRIPLTDEFNQWIRENIASEFTDTGVNYRYCNSDTGGIHTDTTREFALTYNIITGGPRCRVVYWQEDNQPLERDRGIQHLNFDTVKPVFELPAGPDNVWFLHNTTMLHSIEGLSSPRIQFTVGFLRHQLNPEWLN